tara:strand:- start:496 stop:729 length:234 start_codon:yes stop_codon:yes gene_type:complete
MEKKEYRTREQWKTISEQAYYGNWTRAMEYCVEYGFFSNDLIQKYAEDVEFDMCILKGTDLAILSEGAERLRNRKGE